MAYCDICEETVNDDEDETHMSSIHPDVCDEYLQEYVPDSVRDAAADHIHFGE